jgi:molybdopterin molybdotransferase
VAIFSSGDELLTVEQPLSPGKIYDANLAMLSCQVKQAGGQPINLGIAADQEAAILGLLELAASSQVDLIVSSAGVSVGAFDYVRSVVETQGNLDFWRVNMRPGKPLAFGSFRNIPMFGLPGNPVSAFIGFEVFIRPAILKMTGASQERRRQRVYLGEAIELDGRETYLRAIIDPTANNLAHLSGHQGSGNLCALVGANALLIIPSGVKSLPAGAELDAWLLDD